jgi:hypothetical protein
MMVGMFVGELVVIGVGTIWGMHDLSIGTLVGVLVGI